MAATFDPTLATLKDHIRLALGDTNVNTPLLDDQTINAKLAAFSYCEALAQCAEALISQFGQRPSEYGESGGVRITWGERISAWRKIVEDARSGRINPPTTTRAARSRIALQETSKQAQTPSTARTDASVPTLMEGFRAD